MKQRLCLFLTLILIFACVGCVEKTPDPDQKDPSTPDPPITEEPIKLSELNVEFVSGDRDADALLALKKAFPERLISALSAQNVSVDQVNITFGPSATATADALAAGRVQVAWLPLETYLQYEGQMLAVSYLEHSGGDHALIQLALSETGQNSALKDALTKEPQLSALTQQELLQAHWALPSDDNVSKYFLELLLTEAYENISFSDLSHVEYYTEEADLSSSADLIIRYRSEQSEEDSSILSEILINGDVVAISTADAIIHTEAFAAALQQALSALSADEDAQEVLAYYGSSAYLPSDDTQYQLQRELFSRFLSGQ